MQNEFSTFIHNYVLDNQMPARDLARALGKPYSTLLRELNPYDSGAKLGAESLFQIMSITGNYKPLEFMAERLGIEISIQAKNTMQEYDAVENLLPHVTPGAFHLDSQNVQGVDTNFCPTCGKYVEEEKQQDARI